MKKTIKYISILLSFFFILSIFPLIANADEGTYELSEDGFYLDIYGNLDYSTIELPNSIYQITIHNANIDKPLIFSHNDLISYLQFENCSITTKDIGSFNKLETINFTKCNFKDCEFFANSLSVDAVFFDSCFVSSFDALKKLSNLKILYFWDVGVESIDFVKGLDKLEELGLISTCVTDLSPIKNSNIKSLDISNSLSIKDLSPLMTLKKLKSLVSINCEMLYTKELYDFLCKNNVYTNIEEKDLLIREKVEIIANDIFLDTMTETEKIETTVKYVVDKMEYDYNVLENEELSIMYNENALNYALQGVGCCRNYTILTTALLQLAGIDVYEIKNCDHIWNLIKLNNNFYWLDVTGLDDMTYEEMFISDNYMNDEYIFVDHEPLSVPISMYNKYMGIQTEKEETTTQNDISTVNDKEIKTDYKPFCIIVIICVASLILVVKKSVVLKKYR